MVVGLGELTAELVEAMRERLAAGESSVRGEARAHGVSPGLVSRIRTGQAWPDAGGPVESPVDRRVLSDDDVVTMRELWWGSKRRVGEIDAEIEGLLAERDGLRVSLVGLGEQFGVSHRYVKLVVEGEARREAGGPTGL